MTHTAYLTAPDVQYHASYMRAVYEFLAEGRPPMWHLNKLQHHFDEYVAMLLASANDPLPDRVPETHLWLIDTEEYIGRCSVRHHLNDSLLRYGGHIGYEIRPSKRRMGYGVRQCQLAIDVCHRMGIRDILITCDDDNVGSYKIIEACGGVLQDRIDNGRHALTRRYWVRS